MREARAHALDDGFLGGKTHGKKSHRPRRALELRSFLGQQQMSDETFAVLLIHAFDAINLQNIDADAENHEILAPAAALALRIKAFISPTALANPSMMERATIE